jgi:type VI protein secretion system component VasK
MKNLDAVLGLLGIGVGLIGVGYAIGTHSKMAKISENLDRSIEELASNTPVDIPEDMIKRAADKAVAYEVKQVVKKATDTVVADIKKDIHRQVSDAVETEYSNIRDSVLEALTEEAANIDAKRVRADVERAAKDRALKKFDDNLDDILENYKSNLNNVARIYKTFADAATPSNSGGTVLRIG